MCVSPGNTAMCNNNNGSLCKYTAKKKHLAMMCGFLLNCCPFRLLLKTLGRERKRTVEALPNIGIRISKFLKKFEFSPSLLFSCGIRVQCEQATAFGTYLHQFEEEKKYRAFSVNGKSVSNRSSLLGECSKSR